MKRETTRFVSGVLVVTFVATVLASPPPLSAAPFEQDSMLAGEADSPDPAFIYDAETGVMFVWAHGHYITDIVVPGPAPLESLLPPFLINSRDGFVLWRSEYFRGKFQAYDAINNGQDGEFALARYAPGYHSFGEIEWGAVPVPGQPGESGVTQVWGFLGPPPTISADAGGPYVLVPGQDLHLDANHSSASFVLVVQPPQWDLDSDGAHDDREGYTATVPADYWSETLGWEVGEHYTIALRMSGHWQYGEVTDVATATVSIVPEPTTLVLLTSGGLAMFRRRRLGRGR